MSQRGAFILNSVGHKQLTTIVQKYSVTGTNISTVYIPIANSWESAGATGTYGWWTGGGNGNIDRIDFANDSPTAASPRTKLTLDGSGVTGFGNANYGWFTGLGTGVSRIDRIEFANDSPATASTRGPLLVGRNFSGSFSNSNYGWVGGGSNGTTVFYSRVDRVNFSNDSPMAASPRGILNQNKNGISGTANANYGWFGGGYFNPVSTYYSTVERLDFSNDSVTVSLRGTLPSVFANSSAAGNVNYGWWSNLNSTGVSNSTTYRIDFSNDSPTAASTRGPLGYASQAGAAAGNSNFGWFGGGATSVVSTVSRIDYSNDSPAAGSIRGPLVIARGNMGATSNYVKSLPNFVGVGSVTTGTFGVFGTPSSIDTSTGIVYVGSANFSWIGGSASTRVDRIDFANDSPTASSPRGNLASPASSTAAAGNANYGWFGGGNVVSTVQRIDFANDNNLSSIRGPLSVAKNQPGAASNANYGWWSGGLIPAPSAVSTVDRVDFSNDLSITSIRGPLSSARWSTSGIGNADYGWWGGGLNPSLISIVDRIDWSNDSPTSTSPRGPLTIARQLMGAAGNQNYGWFGGGFIAAATSVVDRIDFANDSPTASSPRGGLTAARYGIGAAGNSINGWFAGGQIPAATSIVNRIDFANDSPTSASPRGGLGIARGGLSAVSNYVKDRIDYRSGGINVNVYAATTASNTASGVTIFNGTFGWVGGTSSSVERIDFATDSATASVRGPLSLARMLGSTSHNAQYGWFIGGLQPASPYARYSTVDRIDYANDSPTAAVVRGNLSIANAQHTAMGNIYYGWSAGGETVLGTSSLYSSVDRIDYSNDSTTASPRGPLTAARGYMDATANQFYGWIAGGGFTTSPVAYSTVERIDFGNDSPTSAAARSNLQTATYEIAAAGNRNYGWFHRGGAGTSVTDRIDYSNDTANAVGRANLSQVRTKHSATSNSSYGWWVGGFVTPNPVSTVDRIDFSNDTLVAVARGSLAATRYGTASASNYVTNLFTGFVVTQYIKASSAVGTGVGTYGWISGGAPGTFCIIDRIDFSNDTATALARGTMLVGRQSHGFAGNASYGWNAGGRGDTLVDRLDYSNDVVNATSRGPLVNLTQGNAAGSNNSYGWWLGYFSPGPTVRSHVDRIDFANDSPTTASPRGPLSQAKGFGGATGNQNYIWFMGGDATNGGTALTNVDRIDCSNDSPTSASPRGLLLRASSQSAVTGNSNYGYTAGGGGTTTNVNRISFSNDTVTGLSRGNLITAKYQPAGSGNADFGWSAGGSNGGADFSTVERMSYANDTTVSSTRGTLTATVRRFAAGTSNYTK